MHEIILLGNNLAMLVAALELSSRGRKVVLMLDGKSAGGHFSGAQFDGYNFDIGMVLFERAASAAQSSELSEYRPQRRNDSARFTTLTANYLDRYISTVRVPTPQVFAGGRRYADFVVANRLDCFSSLVDPEIVRGELSDVPVSDALHASRKLVSSAYDSASYEQASLFNHGPTLHSACFEPLCEKILGVSSSTILARYHRLAWLPLYHPETVLKVVSGGQECLAEYPFWSAVGGFSGELTRSLKRSLLESSVEIVEEAVSDMVQDADGRYTVTVQNVEYSSFRLGLGLTQERARQLLRKPATQAAEGVSVSILFGLVPRRHLVDVVSSLFVLDSEYAVYRVSDQDACAGLDPEWHRLSIEINPVYFARLYPEINVNQQQACILAEIVRLKVISELGAFKVLRYIQVANALPLPTVTALHDSVQFAAELCDQSGLELTGSLLGMGVSSINDQIVQGLKLAEQWG